MAPLMTPPQNCCLLGLQRNQWHADAVAATAALELHWVQLLSLLPQYRKQRWVRIGQVQQKPWQPLTLLQCSQMVNTQRWGFQSLRLGHCRSSSDQ